MDAPPLHEEPHTPTLKYKTSVLKVSIHCIASNRKVKKVLQNIQGVYTVDIDSKQHKVTVVGNVEVDLLVKKLVKTGKHAEKWPENPTKLEKPTTAGENKDSSDEEDHNNPTDKGNNGGPSVKFAGVQDNKPVPASGKKKKKKKSSGAGGPADTGTVAPDVGSIPVVEQVRWSPPRGDSYPMPAGPAYVVCYSTGMGGPAYHILPTPYTYVYAEDDYDFEMLARPSDTFQMLSDENPYGCYVM